MTDVFTQKDVVLISIMTNTSAEQGPSQVVISSVYLFPRHSTTLRKFTDIFNIMYIIPILVINLYLSLANI
jgi:hypothetical protein